MLTDWGHLTLAEGALGEGEDEEVWSEETREGEEFSEVEGSREADKEETSVAVLRTEFAVVPGVGGAVLAEPGGVVEVVAVLAVVLVVAEEDADVEVPGQRQQENLSTRNLTRTCLKPRVTSTLSWIATWLRLICKLHILLRL